MLIEVTDIASIAADPAVKNMMLAGANATAARVAPCLFDGLPSPGQVAEAKLVLFGAIKRWAEASSGALSAEQAGPFSATVDTRQRTGYSLWPSEIERLQDICRAPSAGGNDKAFTIDTVSSAGAHLPWCSAMFGAAFCSCGVDIAGRPIYENLPI